MLITVAHLLALLSLTLHDAVWPLAPEPEVVEEFAPPAQRWASGHRGVDLLGREGQPVRAAQAGRVTFAGMLAGRGVVVVSHGRTRTTYEPVAATRRVGEQVGAGDRIGSLQRHGSHCWPRTCLHWGLIDGETYLDPLGLLGAGPVRLLPLLSDLRADGALPPAPPAGPPFPLLPGALGMHLAADPFTAPAPPLAPVAPGVPALLRGPWWPSEADSADPEAGPRPPPRS